MKNKLRKSKVDLVALAYQVLDDEFGIDKVFLFEYESENNTIKKTIESYSQPELKAIKYLIETILTGEELRNG